ncbi:MAG: DUF4330 family protein [Clostridia bacterium]|nr:DUF4330 family protein [Clostridia bacterium]
MKKFNIIDVIIVAVIILAVAAAVVLKSGGGSDMEKNTKTVTLELVEKRVGFSKNVIVGDKVTEKVKKVQIGKITGVEARPAEKNSYDRITGEAAIINIPEREDVYVTMEIDGSAEVYVGKQLSVITKHFSGSGFVVAVSNAN